MTNNTNTPAQQTDEIDLGEVFRVIGRYKYSILLITLVTTIAAAIFAYFSPNIYKARSTVYVKHERGASDDFMSLALGTKNSNVENETAILQSRHIVNLALKKLNTNVRYFTKQKRSINIHHLLYRYSLPQIWELN